MPERTMIEIANVTRSYGTFKALDDAIADDPRRRILLAAGAVRLRQDHACCA